MVTPDCPGDGLAWPGLDASAVRHRKPSKLPTDPDPAPTPVIKQPAYCSSSWLRPVYSTIWSIALALCRLVLCLWLTVRECYAFLRKRRSRGLVELEVLGTVRKEELRLPRHLAVVVQELGSSHFSEEVPSWMTDLASLVVWCLVVGIPFVTLYDTAGG